MYFVYWSVASCVPFHLWESSPNLLSDLANIFPIVIPSLPHCTQRAFATNHALAAMCDNMRKTDDNM